MVIFNRLNVGQCLRNLLTMPKRSSMTNMYINYQCGRDCRSALEDERGSGGYFNSSATLTSHPLKGKQIRHKVHFSFILFGLVRIECLPIVGIGSSHPLPRKRVCLPLGPERGEQHSLAGEGVGDHQFGRGQKSWHSVCSVV